MKSFKKILASIGMLGIAVPASLNVVACGQNSTPNTVKVIKKADLNGMINTLVYGSDGNLYANTYNLETNKISWWKIDLKNNKAEKINNEILNNCHSLVPGSDGTLYGSVYSNELQKHQVFKYNPKNNELKTVSLWESGGGLTALTEVNGTLYGVGWNLTSTSMEIYQINFETEKFEKKVSFLAAQYEYNCINLIPGLNNTLYAIFESSAIRKFNLAEEWKNESIYTPKEESGIKEAIKISETEIAFIHFDNKEDNSSFGLISVINFNGEIVKKLQITAKDLADTFLFLNDNKLDVFVVCGRIEDDHVVNLNYQIHEFDLTNWKETIQNDIKIGDGNQDPAVFYVAAKNKLYAGTISGKVYEISI